MPEPPTRPLARRLPAILAATLVLALGLSACGQQPAEPAATPPRPAQPAGATPPKPEAPPLGSLVDRMNAAWKDVTTYRASFTGAANLPVSASGGATPVAGSAEPLRIEQEIAGPDRRRETMTGAGKDDHEAIVDGDLLYLRGPLAAATIPGTAPDEWVVLPAASISPETELGHVLAGFVAPPRSPLASVGDNLRPQGMRDLGPREVEGKTCRAWGVADTTEIGTRLDITVAVDGQSLPCLLETRLGTEVVSSVTYDAWGEPIEIAIPADAKPAAPPAGAPDAHD